MEKKYVGAIDQGTTSTRFVLFNRSGEVTASHQLEHKQIYPQPGFVEHDPVEILHKTHEVISLTLKNSSIKSSEISCLGITNQRETTVVWNKNTGIPYYNAIVWQDTRTDKICKKLGDINRYREITGLPLATYFSGPKLKWLLDNIAGLRKDAENGTALFGTIDTWLLWNLTGGTKGGAHITDVTNASRTLFMDLYTLNWDKNILKEMDIPDTMLPVIKSSSEIYGYTSKDLFDNSIPITSILGDQHAALFGQTCFHEGEAKNTYGTGCFMLLNTGDKIIYSKQGLITTCAYKIGNEKVCYALEGSIAIAGSLVQWFRDNFGIIKKSQEIEDLANTVTDNGGVYIVPAFSGLFAPYWRSDARGVIAGLSHYANKGHVARAILESTAFQTKDIFNAMIKEAEISLKTLKVDGGMVVNETLMQFQADILGIDVIKPKLTEITSLGAAYAAGLAIGFWKNKEELKINWKKDKVWKPNMTDKVREKLYKNWNKAVEKTFNWNENE